VHCTVGLYEIVHQPTKSNCTGIDRIADDKAIVSVSALYVTSASAYMPIYIDLYFTTVGSHI